jgi:transcriptional regulator with XRE-family HTH domain
MTKQVLKGSGKISRVKRNRVSEFASGRKWLSGHDTPSVKDLRVYRGMSQGELARRLDVTQGHLSHIETFKVKPSPTVFQRIYEVLEVPEDNEIRVGDTMRDTVTRKKKVVKNETMNALLDFELKHGHLVLLTEANFKNLQEEHERSQRVDDRICMHYVVDRLEDCIKEKDYSEMRKAVQSFKEECVYNLGVNTRIKKEAADV